LKKFAQHQTTNTTAAAAAPTPGGDLPSAATSMPAPLAKAALAALARINSRLNLKPTQQQQPENNYSNIKELATAAAGEISKQLQQAKTNGSGEMDMDLDESNKQDSGAAASGPLPADGAAPLPAGSAAPKADGAPTIPNAAPTAGEAPKPGDVPKPATAPAATGASKPGAPAATGASKPGAAPVIVQGSIPGLPSIPKGLPSLSAIKSSQKAPPPNAQSKPRAENPPSAKVSAPEQLPSLPLPSPEAPAGEATLI